MGDLIVKNDIRWRELLQMQIAQVQLRLCFSRFVDR